MFNSVKEYPRIVHLFSATREEVEKIEPFLAPYHASKGPEKYYPSLDDHDKILANNGWMLGGPFHEERIDGESYKAVYVAVNRSSAVVVIAAFVEQRTEAKFYVGKVNREYASQLEYALPTN